MGSFGLGSFAGLTQYLLNTTHYYSIPPKFRHWAKLSGFERFRAVFWVVLSCSARFWARYWACSISRSEPLRTAQNSSKQPKTVQNRSISLHLWIWAILSNNEWYWINIGQTRQNTPIRKTPFQGSGKEALGAACPTGGRRKKRPFYLSGPAYLLVLK